jgi:hypothetical protein
MQTYTIEINEYQRLLLISALSKYNFENAFELAEINPDPTGINNNALEDSFDLNKMFQSIPLAELTEGKTHHSLCW